MVTVLTGCSIVNLGQSYKIVQPMLAIIKGKVHQSGVNLAVCCFILFLKFVFTPEMRGTECATQG